MIKYLKHEEIDTEKWDQCIDQSVNGILYAYSWYLDLVHSSWEALVENNYERVMPLTAGRKLGIDYLYQPPFTQQLGIFSTSQLSDAVIEDFMKVIPAKFKFIEINLNTHNKFRDNVPGYHPWLTHEQDLISPYESIRANYSSNLKRNLKKAEQAKISIAENIKPDEIISIFKKNRGKLLPGMKDENYDLLRRIIYVLIYKRMAYVVGAYTETNNLCAGAFFVYSKKKAIFYFSATDETAKATGAMSLLIDHFIRKHANTHTTLDFEGSNDPSLARFYKSFGASEVTYPHIKINRLNPFISLGVELVKRLRF
ncbi:MAG: hypothetical protein IH598_01650 [Bacteroidales bacterium]|nr:hypothetical protein [Bacteroidales bacterium]